MNEMTYDSFIDNILNTRGRHGCDGSYHETHHILPKCCGGNDDDQNLIDLYASEHFVAHKLLAFENPDNNKLVYAWWCMCTLPGSSKKRIEVTAEEYEKARIAFCNIISESQKNENNSFYGKHHAEETRERLSKALSGENNPHYGKVCSDDTKMKISESNSGRTVAEETRKKLSMAHSGNNNGMYRKHHSENTKSKMSQVKNGKYNGNNNPMYGKYHSEDAKEKIRQAKIGKKDSDETRKKKSESKLGAKHPKSKMVFCVELNQYFGSTGEAAREIGVQQAGISRCCNNKQEYAGCHPQTGEKLHWKYTNKINNSFIA